MKNGKARTGIIVAAIVAVSMVSGQEVANYNRAWNAININILCRMYEISQPGNITQWDWNNDAAITNELSEHFGFQWLIDTNKSIYSHFPCLILRQNGEVILLQKSYYDGLARGFLNGIPKALDTRALTMDRTRTVFYPTKEPQSSTLETPELNIINSSFSFSNIYYREKGGLILSLTNYGKKDVNINSVTVDCGCVAITNGVGLLRAGQGVNIPLKYHSTSYVGPFRKRLIIRSNDPICETIGIPLEGNVLRDVQVTPLAFLCGRIEPLTSVTNRLQFIALDGKSLCKKAEVEGTRLRTIIKTTNNVTEILLIAYNDCILSNKNEEFVTLHTTSHHEPTIKIPIVAEFVNPLEVTPSVLNLGDCNKSSIVERSIKLRYSRQAIDVVPMATFDTLGIEAKSIGKVTHGVDIEETWKIIIDFKKTDLTEVFQTHIQWQARRRDGVPITVKQAIIGNLKL